MGATTGIEWTDSTWNPLRGCSKVSAGCDHCYAEGMAARFSGPGLPYHNVIRNGHWNGSVELSKKHLLDPLKWKPGRPIYDAATGKEVGCDATQSRRIFVNSMSDLFHPNVPDEWIDRIFAVMALCPQHIFQVLTKRPERMLEYLSGAAWQRCCKSAGPYEMEKSIPLEKYADRSHILDGHGNLISVFSRWPLPNVWLGVSIENQDAADERIPLLLQTPAAVRFVSCEPMLGLVDLTVLQHRNEFEVNALTGDHGVLRPLAGRSDRKLDWVICGGESGPGARPMHENWARGLRDQCAAAGVPFFFKQWGEWAPTNFDLSIGGAVSGDGAMARVGKKAAGALLDGREYKYAPGAVGV